MRIKLDKVPVEALKNLPDLIIKITEQQGVADQVNGFVISAEVVVQFDVAGTDELQVLTTDHIVNGQPEMLTVVPEFDENWNIKGMIDNQEQSFMADVKALTDELPNEAIESEFDADKLLEESRVTAGNITEITFSHLLENFKVVQYHIEGVGLVAEVKMEPKDDDIEQ
jgi:hypothetical protein